MIALLEKVLNIEEAVESAWAGVLLPAAKAHSEFQDKETLTPRFEVRLQGVAATDAVLIGGLQRPYQWDAVLVTRIVTLRSHNSDQHNQMIARVRIEAWRFLHQLTDDNLQYHYVTRMHETPGTRTHDPDTGLDITELHFAIKIEIKSEQRTELAKLDQG